MTVTIRFVGTGGAFADGGRGHACIFVRAAGVSLLLDCGGSALPAIRSARIADGIDAVVVSHLHGDHFGGIPYLLLQQHFAGRRRPLLLAGPPSLRERLDLAKRSLFPDFFERTPLAFDVPTFPYGREMPLSIGQARLEWIPVVHAPGSEPYGLRVRAGDRLVAYSGDAAWSDALPRLADGADLFICEATHYRDIGDPSHIAYETLMAHRDELACERIVLTHLGATVLENIARLELPYATDGLEIAL